MYNLYLKETINQKIECDLAYLIEFISFYLYIIIRFEDKYNKKGELLKISKLYFKYSLLEYKLLNLIKKINLENDEDILLILDELEKIFTDNYNALENILSSFERGFELEDLTTIYFRKSDFNIDTIKQYLKKIKANYYN